MKTALVSVLFSLVILGLLAVVGLRWWGPPAAAMPPDGAALSRIDERLDRLERSLARLGDLEQEVTRLSAREALAVPQPTADAAPSVSPAVETAGARTGDAEVAKAQNKVDRWLEANGMREDMENFVARAYEQARKVRMNREREEAEARQREMQELSEGPYGKHNYRVNLLAKRLDLDGRQVDYLFNLLSQYDERASGLKRERDLAMPEGVKPTPEQLEQHFQHVAQASKTLREGLERDFQSRLSTEQQEAYGDLPEEERVAGSAAEKMVYMRRAVDVMAVQGVKIEMAPGVPPAPAAGR